MAGKSLEEIVGAKSLADFILETGESNGISYVKWKSGKVEFYGSLSVSGSSNATVAFPFPYSSVPLVFASWIGSAIASNPVNSVSAGSFDVQHPDAGTHVLNWHSIGTISAS